MKNIGFLFVFILLFLNAFSQENDCKVLLEQISEIYIGDCKDGLAHGKGEAKGTHKYIGKFKKGYPHGNGKYIWANGDYYEGNWKEGKKSGKGAIYTVETDTKLKGFWKNDIFIKEIVDPPYEVTFKSGITGIYFYEDNKTPHRIEFVFQKDGSQSNTVGNLLINSSSGQSTISRTYSGVENVLFPFEGSLEFVEPSRMGTTMIRYEVKFTLTKESSWRVVVRY